MGGYDDDLRLALVIADMVDSHTMSRFQAVDLAVETKPDLTPVSDADRAAEEIIRGQLKRSRPRDAVVGEEFAPTGHSARRWVVDPIDGTKNFVRGVPVWATLIGLMIENEVVLGVVSAPALARKGCAAGGTGAWTGRSLASARRIRVSGVHEVEDASLSYSSYEAWEDLGRGEPRVAKPGHRRQRLDLADQERSDEPICSFSRSPSDVPELAGPWSER